jgi:hypothetical protein
MGKQSGWIEGGNQPSLPFSDRETSHEAAESMGKSSGTLRTKVFLMILSSGDRGMTDDEIEEESGLIGSTCRPRRRELVLAGKVVANGEKRPTRTGRLAKVYVASGDQ